MRVVARFLIITITICSWFMLSNHCAIGAIATKAQTPQTGCPFHSNPAKRQPQPTATECCKILRAVANAAAKNLKPSVVDFPDINLTFVECAILMPPKISLSPATLDTGPPGKTSFLELNRSLRAHAPPLVI